MLDLANRRKAVAERSDSVAVADENVTSLDLECLIGELPPPSEVSEYFPVAPVGPGDAVVAGHGPGDVRSEEPLEGGARAPAVELVLRLVKPVEKGDGGVAVQSSTRPDRSAQRHPTSALVRGGLEGVVEGLELRLGPVAAPERDLDQPVGEPGVLRQQRSV